MVAAGRGPAQPGTVVFKTLQTYSSGEVVRWIQVASSQDPNPDSPAPTLTVTPAAATGSTAGSTSGSSTTSSTDADVLAVTALVAAVIGIAGVILLLVLRRRPSPGAATSADASPDGTPPDPS